MAKTFILADESVNHYGFWLPMSGADLKQFKKNPVMLWMHSRPWRGTKDEVLPIGRWENIRIEEDKLLADAVFDQDDEFAMAIAGKVEKQYIRMASIGLRIIATSNEPKFVKPGQTRETPVKWSVREASIVDIGGNDNAFTMAFYDEDDEIINLADKNKQLPIKELVSNINQNTSTMKKIAVLLSLADDTAEDLIVSKVKEILDKNIQLTSELSTVSGQLKLLEEEKATARKTEVATLLDSAIQDGRIDASLRNGWERLFEKDHESAKATLLAVPVRRSLRDSIEGDESRRKDEYNKLVQLSWDEMDRTGVLATVKEKYIDLYNEKFQEKFGKKPQ